VKQFVFCFGLCLLLLLASRPGGAAEEAPFLPISPEQREALAMATARVTPVDRVPGRLLPARVVVPNAQLQVVSSRTPAVVVSLAVSVGEKVKEGQKLALLESPSFVSIQREFLEALSRGELARQRAEREGTLAEEGVIAGRRGLESLARLREMEAHLEDRRQALLLAGMSDKALRALTERRVLEPGLAIRASFSGVILEQYVRVGERVPAGAPLYRLGRVDTLEVEIHTPLERARHLQVGSRFEIPEWRADGRIVAIGQEVHIVDQGVVVRGALEGGESDLRPGQFVRVRFAIAGSERSAYRIPDVAVVRVSGRTWVFVSSKEGFQPTEVEVLGGSGREVVVDGPFQADSDVAVRGTASLKALWLASGMP